MQAPSDLASRIGCSVDLAKAALARSKNRTAAERLLREGPSEAYKGIENAFGQGAGDSIFAHAYVKCLMDVARARLEAAFAEQPDTSSDRWLICVRTYGRASTPPPPPPSEIMRYLQASVAPSVKQDQLEEYESRLGSAGLHRIAAVQAAMREDREHPAEALRKHMSRAKVRPLRAHILEAFCRTAKGPIPDARERKVKPRNRGLRDMTLQALTDALGPDASSRCFIFVAHSDPDYVDGRYAAALAGTPWASRIVEGVRGAQFQVRFIEEVAPQGAHIIIADDNICEFVVESSQEDVVKERIQQHGTQECYRRTLDSSSEWPDALHRTGLTSVEESDLRRYLRGALQSKSSEYEALATSLAAAGFGALPDLTSVLREDLEGSVSAKSSKLNAALREAGQPELRFPILKRLWKQLELRLPSPHFLAKPAELPAAAAAAVPLLKRPAAAAAAGASRKQGSPGSLVRETELVALIRKAAKMMDITGAKLWGVNQSQNHYFLGKKGSDLRARALKLGEFTEHSEKLGLIYGAFFGFRVMHQESRYTRFGQVKDDVERSLRYWHEDGVVLRFSRYAVDKLHKPGTFGKAKGGISAASSEEKHQEEATRALEGIVSSFAFPYVRLAKDDEKHCCGLVWHVAGKKSKRSKVPEGVGTAKGTRKAGAKAATRKDVKKVASKNVILPSGCEALKKAGYVQIISASRRGGERLKITGGDPPASSENAGTGDDSAAKKRRRCG
eukprot:TRINITY_DN13902_c0_g3_i1.p1 TRINITY_DN13902_c0_g3~~TRINITY_DN13902_c0_g3_i1.p1  ORF type:complete len:732 (-),score=153.69 TRINITY_DN13902_c0_g3_i1:400-2595(-)